MTKHLLTVLCILHVHLLFAQINFHPSESIQIGSDPQVVAIGDLNNDGLNDVALATEFYFDEENDFHIFIFIQNEQGGLNEPIKFQYPPIFNGVTSMIIEDVNSDDLNDLVIGYTDSLGIYFQSQTGNLEPLLSYYSGDGVNGVKAGDFNNDGLKDLVVSHFHESFIRVFYQSSTGFSSMTYPKPQGGFDDLKAGDVNSDGLDDVVFMSGSNQSAIHVFTQNAEGTLNNYVSYSALPGAANHLAAIDIGDLNNDGRNDIVASFGGNIPSSKIAIWFQNPQNGMMINQPLIIDAYEIPESIWIDDINCDSKNEIILLHSGFLKISVYEQDSNGSYNSYKLFNTPYGLHFLPDALAVGDINNDGKIDMVVANRFSDMVLHINNSLPEEYTIFSNDVVSSTLYSNNFLSAGNLTSTNQSTSNNYLTTETNVYAINSLFEEDSIRVDSIIVFSASLCGQDYFDTTVISRFYYDIRLIDSDTTLISASRDSFNVTPGIKVYPNPNRGVFTVNLPAPFDKSGITIEIFNDLGALVFFETFKDQQNSRTLDISGIANGVYLLRVSLDKLMLTSAKLVIID
jgi:hypothetical protein